MSSGHLLCARLQAARIRAQVVEYRRRPWPWLNPWPWPVRGFRLHALYQMGDMARRAYAVYVSRSAQNGEASAPHHVITRSADAHRCEMAWFMLGALAPLLRSERVRYPVLRCVAPIAVRVRLLHNCMIWTRVSYVRDMSVDRAHQACVPQAARLRKQACLYK